ncbi:hypothetical protein HRbin22_00238 [Candidatus Thermoflexus japonica]|uniref:TctA family transporter n=1 Tax=Candidatus Thermoflexus japonica TaxID=2035417 RepID=A0A2H5Y3J6_9CHLR|nr:hypothetical protein HRbin22_00238 [Candidatus Thermoflexus japonica]
MSLPELLLGIGIGMGLSGLSALIPGLHPYNLIAALILGLRGNGWSFPQDLGSGLGIGVAVGYAFFHLAPAVFYQTPDEGAAGLLLPAQKALREGWGFEAVRWSGWGAWGALLLMLLSAPLWPRGWAVLRAVLMPHMGWLLLSIVAFMLLSEWPWGAERLPTPGQRLRAVWLRLGAGLLTFALSGLLGVLLLSRNPLAGPLAHQPLVPAFLGLFAIPGLIQGLTGSRPPPPAASGRSLSLGAWMRGLGAGVLGGAFAVLFPGVTAGIGGLLAGHATAQRDERAFLVSQGAARAFYIIGSFWLLLLPEAPTARGGLSAMLAPWIGPATPARYQAAVWATGLAGALAFGLLGPLAQGMQKWSAHPAWRWAYGGALGLILLSTAALGGFPGICALAAATGIGWLPVLTGSRRLNTLGVILIPLLLRRFGLEGGIRQALGLY